MKLKPDGIGGEGAARQPCPLHRVLALLDPLLAGAALIENRNGLVIDGRTTRHPGYAVSARRRKRIEEIFGWNKATAGLRKRDLVAPPVVEQGTLFAVEQVEICLLPFQLNQQSSRALTAFLRPKPNLVEYLVNLRCTKFPCDGLSGVREPIQLSSNGMQNPILKNRRAGTRFLEVYDPAAAAVFSIASSSFRHHRIASSTRSWGSRPENGPSFMR